ncbi:hypothetical protein [Emergencia timonensis]|uniref:hypothetical protein n=1 Tax=Emergencia timonensis TaxID=1776384 RepID=UPI0039968B23
MTGVAASVEAVLICLALGIPAGTAAVVSMATIALWLGLSHVYWTKKVAYGEDSQYICVKTKPQFYRNSSRTTKIGNEIVTYQKKAKGGSYDEPSNDMKDDLTFKNYIIIILDMVGIFVVPTNSIMNRCCIQSQQHVV